MEMKGDLVERFLGDSFKAIRVWAKKTEAFDEDFNILFRPEDAMFISLLDHLMRYARRRGYDICLAEGGSRLIAHSIAYAYLPSTVDFEDVVDELEMKLADQGVPEEEIGECIKILEELLERLGERIKLLTIEVE